MDSRNYRQVKANDRKVRAALRLTGDVPVTLQHHLEMLDRIMTKGK